MPGNDLSEAPLDAGGFSYTSPTFLFGAQNAGINGGLSFDLPLAIIQSFQNNAYQFLQTNSDANKAFLSSVMGQSQQSVNATASQVIGFQNNALATLQKFGKDLAKGLAKPGCFITTAICQSEGKPDDCDELQTLRKFRDTVLVKRPAWRHMVRRYYEIAPKIVAGLNARADAKQCYDNLRTNFLLPAIEAVKHGQTYRAIQYYRMMVSAAQSMVGPLPDSGISDKSIAAVSEPEKTPAIGDEPETEKANHE